MNNINKIIEKHVGKEQKLDESAAQALMNNLESFLNKNDVNRLSAFFDDLRDIILNKSEQNGELRPLANILDRAMTIAREIE